MARDYKEEYREYHGTEEQIKRRAARVNKKLKFLRSKTNAHV
jgi:hypothetical protein